MSGTTASTADRVSSDLMLEDVNGTTAATADRVSSNLQLEDENAGCDKTDGEHDGHA